MKFCSKCGAELFDDAAICTKCGRMVEGVPAASNKPLLLDKKPSVVLTVFNFVFSLTAVLSLFWLVLGIGFGYVDVSVTNNYYTGVSVSAYYYPDFDFIVSSFIFSLPTFAFGLVSFILTLVEKHRGERLFAGVIKLIIGFFLMIAMICLLGA